MDITDAFVVTLGLDPSQYQNEIKKYRDDRKRLSQEDEKYNRQSEDAQRRAVDGMRTLRNETAGFLLMLAGANSVKQFAQDIITGDAATGRLAKNLGMATEELSAWEGAIKRVGGSAADIDSALRSMSTAFQSLQLTGTTGHDADFQGLGVTAKDLQDPQAALLKISEAASRMSRPEFNARLARIGFDQNTINLLAKGRQGVTQLLEEQRKFGVTTDQDAEAAQRLIDKLSALESMLKGKARPAIESMVDLAADWLSKQENLNTVVAASEGVLVAMGVAAVAAYGPLALLAGAVALVAANINKLQQAWQDYEDWWSDAKTNGDEFFDPVRKALGLPSGADMEKQNQLKAETAKGWLNGKPNDFFGGVVTNKWEGDDDQAAILARLNPGGGKTVYSNFRGGVRGGGWDDDAPSGSPYAAILARIRSKESDGLGGYNAQAYNTSAGSNSAGLSQANLTGMTIGQIYDYQRGAMRARTRGMRGPTDVGSTGVGAYQFESGTLRAQAERVFGSNWRNVRFTPQNQDRLAANLYSTVKDNPTLAANTWAALKPGALNGRGGGGVSHANTTQTTTVGQVVIYTAATDAVGIARDMRGELAKRGLVVQANTGVLP